MSAGGASARSHQRNCTRRLWDVIIIGAGPAGSTAAREAAKAGASTLLLDKSSFPRDKVCGCCLSAAALELLARAGLGDLTADLGGMTLHRLQIRSGRRSIDLPLPTGCALSRRTFDAELVRRATAAGAVFQSGINAKVGPAEKGHRVVTIGRGKNNDGIRGRVIIAAHGISEGAMERVPALASAVRARSYIGLQAMTSAGGSMPLGAIVMHCARGGYVGMVQLESGQVAVAAALDPRFVRAHADPGRAISSLLQEAGADAGHAWTDLGWKGTPLLTRHRPRVSAKRLLLAGDAIGYVEPITGEGITWALATGAAAGRAAARAAGTGWSAGVEEQWHRTCRAMVAGGHLRCLVVTRLLRQPLLRRCALGVLERSPRLAAALTGWISRGIPGG